MGLMISPVVAGSGAGGGGGGSGTVTSVSVVSANGFAGSVANATTTPAITLTTSITGILSGNGTAVSAATTTGSGSVVLATSPTLVTPVLGVASATTLTMSGRILGAQGADVASANDLTLGADGNTFEITGATQINAITTTGWQNGSSINLLFTSNPTVKNNTAGGAGTAPLLLAGSVDFGATAGDVLVLLLSEIGGTQAWRELGRTAI